VPCSGIYRLRKTNAIQPRNTRRGYRQYAAFKASMRERENSRARHVCEIRTALLRRMKEKHAERSSANRVIRGNESYRAVCPSEIGKKRYTDLASASSETRVFALESGHAAAPSIRRAIIIAMPARSHGIFRGSTCLVAMRKRQIPSVTDHTAGQIGRQTGRTGGRRADPLSQPARFERKRGRAGTGTGTGGQISFVRRQLHGGTDLHESEKKGEKTKE